MVGVKDACERHKQPSPACIIPEILQRLKIPVNVGTKITHCEQTHELQRAGHSINKQEDFISRVLWWLLSAVNSCHTNPNEANSIKQKCSKDTCETGREVFPCIPARKTERLFLCCSQKGDLIKCFAESPSVEISPSAPETTNKEKQGKPQTNNQPLAHQDV